MLREIRWYNIETMPKKERVVVAMSGGVDSAVAAGLLKEQGYEVIGITLCFNLAERNAKRPSCCGLEGIEDARRVARKLGIKHYILNMRRPLVEFVIQDFCSEYAQGRTPNPCVRCNQYIKFGALLEKARSLEAKFLASGHYARVVKAKEGYQLKKAKDPLKDQSYFLYRLNQKQLSYTLFPLGDYSKKETRALAKKFGLPVADKPASQEICFLPQDYREFLKEKIGKRIMPGLVADKTGRVLGAHKGVAFYTVGQRQGLGIAAGFPLYITGIRAEDNLITVGRKEDAYRREFLVKEPHFILKPLKKKVAVKVKIRYNHREAPAEIIPVKRQIKVEFSSPQFAVTPGQAAVFYQRDNLLGGGIIDKVTG